MSTLSPFEHTAIGALAGVLEVSVMQPTVTVKNALQEGRALPKTPLAFYRGYLVNAGSIAPITAVQFGANRFYEVTLKKLTGKDTTQAGQVAVAIAAGSTSSLISAPAELLMIQQGRNQRPLGVEARSYISKHGLTALYRGFGPTFIREGLYTGGYLGVTPVLLEMLKGHPALEGYPSGTPFLIAGVTGGLLAVTTTQPFDTIKTRMQANVVPKETPEYRSSITTMQHVMKQGGGIQALWSGIAPRAFRVVGATFILNSTKNYIVDQVEASRTK